MFKHYECKPIVWHQKPFVFDWDIDTGEIKGADAEKIKQMADGRWQMADGRWQMADGRWQMAAE